ncbi:MAG TPA: hypothetical protein VEF04_17260, partial [Blastocatellia bacterium]|nr:hypothetical protein [Blastocatellia bacterium]
MSKKKIVSQSKSTATSQKANQGRRKFIFAGVGTLTAVAVGAGGYSAGWFSSQAVPSPTPTPVSLMSATALNPLSLSADLPNAIRACDELTRHYTHALDNPYTIIHSVRAFGKDFKRADGSNAVDYLCSKFAAEKEINGKRYVYFQREA